MQKSFLEKIKNVPKFWWIFLAILIVGIFLRAYNYHDWLRFNADQGRDAEIVSKVADGTAQWPLLGPKAGGTEFKLGPAFYYFEIASAKIFGNVPDKMAYPDLISSILCIPLLFFFLRKYVDRKTALVSVAIFAVSAYAIHYARFAWNPNSTPFWTILVLYAIHEVVSEKNNRKFLWAAIAGAAIGVGVQLHTTLLAILPIFAILVFGLLSFRNKKMLKYFFVILAASLLINTPQLISEYQTKGGNSMAFFGGVITKQETENSILESALRGTSCWIQGSTNIISGYEISDDCTFRLKKNTGEAAVFFLGAVFALGGAILVFRQFLKEGDADKKSFLGLVLTFSGITYLLFLNLAFELSMRFYLILIFLPFLLLGSWIQFFKERLRLKPALMLPIFGVFLAFSNLYFIYKSFNELAKYGNAVGGRVNIVILKEAEVLSQFIVANSNNAKDAYIGGDGNFLFKAYKPIRYLAGRSNVNLLLADNISQLPDTYFYAASLSKKEKILKDDNIKVLRYKDCGGFSVMLVQNI